MGETRFIVAGSFIDGTGAGVRRNVFLAVKDGKITAIGSAADLPHCDGVAIDNFSHCTIVPALVDCSVSLSRSAAVDMRVRISFEESDFEQKVALFDRHIRYCHAHGVLAVVDDSDDPTGLMERHPPEMALRNIVAIRTSGKVCRSKDDFAAGSPSGSDYLKIGYSSDIDAEETFLPWLSHVELRHLLLQHQDGKKVVVANGRQAVAEALAAGCDAIEQGYLMGEDNLRRMAEKNVLWIPSVLRAKNAVDSSGSGGDVCCRFSQRYVAPGKPIPGAAAFWKKILADQLAQLRLARTLGVITVVGTGAGSTGILHGESVAEEMKLFIKAGYSLEETIQCASEHGARFFDLGKVGALTVGRQATFLITRGTPHQLPRKLSYLEGIYVDGAPSRAYQKNPVKALW